MIPITINPRNTPFQTLVANRQVQPHPRLFDVFEDFLDFVDKEEYATICEMTSYYRGGDKGVHSAVPCRALDFILSAWQQNGRERASLSRPTDILLLRWVELPHPDVEVPPLRVGRLQERQARPAR